MIAVAAVAAATAPAAAVVVPTVNPTHVFLHEPIIIIEADRDNFSKGSWHAWADRVEALETINKDLIRRINQIEDRRAAAAPTQLFLSGVFLLGIGVVLPGWFRFPLGVWMVWFTVWLVFLSIANIGAVDILVRAVIGGWSASWVKNNKGGGGGDRNGVCNRAEAE